ncbi:hypothetical protein CHS0354_024961 [Potamilus streckersoni]|uniref:Uncharacterized protein n=1 Tax=Potamilus streckersoni TaxID=2493646 RepID=A0AAE0T1Q2_9BIVA|nr:hypothetical protein CHS0354_024961 [Potamilus streckersoni]
MSIYQANLAKVEEEHNSVLEISKIIQSVLRMLRNRRNNNFLPISVREQLRDNDEAESISNEFFSVYKACEDYMMEWMIHLTSIFLDHSARLYHIIIWQHQLCDSRFNPASIPFKDYQWEPILID